MRVAFYKGTRPGWQGVYSHGVRAWTRGKYSHVEVVFSDGVAASSSFVDGGVRFKVIDFDPANWDFIELPDCLAPMVRQWYIEHEGAGYDIWGNVHFVISAVPDSKDKFSCSESVAQAFGLTDPWRYEPNVLHSVLTHLAMLLNKSALT